jgi:hypothetical protein
MNSNLQISVSEHLDEPVLRFARKDFAALQHDLTIAQ